MTSRSPSAPTPGDSATPDLREAFEAALERQARINERSRLLVLAVLAFAHAGVFVFLQTVAPQLLDGLFERPMPLWAPPLFFSGVAGCALVLRHRLGDDTSPVASSHLPWTVAVVEALVPTGLTVLVSHAMDPVHALVAPPTSLYFVVIGLSVLRLSPTLSAITTLVSAAGYTTLAVLALAGSQAGADPMLVSPAHHVAKVFLLVLAGIVAARVSGHLREHTLASLREATARQAEVDAARMAAQVAIESERTQSAFLATMSHEFRTPLAAIIGYADLIDEDLRARPDAVDEEVLEDLGNVRTASRHLLGLVNDVLDLSKLNEGAVELQSEVFEVSSLLESIRATVSPTMAHRGNTFEIKGIIEGWRLTGDSLRVAQILLNLVGNAAKFTREGRVTLTAASSNDWVHFSVADTGIGMTQEVMKRIYSPFVQADPSTTRRYGGTGLGLTIVRRLVDAMGGTIDCRSQPDAGTTFDVRLPLPST